MHRTSKVFDNSFVYIEMKVLAIGTRAYFYKIHDTSVPPVIFECYPMVGDCATDQRILITTLTSVIDFSCLFLWYTILLKCSSMKIT